VCVHRLNVVGNPNTVELVSLIGCAALLLLAPMSRAAEELSSPERYLGARRDDLLDAVTAVAAAMIAWQAAALAHGLFSLFRFCFQHRALPNKLREVRAYVDVHLVFGVRTLVGPELVCECCAPLSIAVWTFEPCVGTWAVRRSPGSTSGHHRDLFHSNRLTYRGRGAGRSCACFAVLDVRQEPSRFPTTADACASLADCVRLYRALH
jgi:hypothetical protein